MKKILLSFLGTFAAVSMAAQPVAPKFTTSGDTTWYYVRFTRGSNVLADQKPGLKTAALSVTAQTQRWALVGSANNFQLLSKTGNRVSWNGSQFSTTSSSTGEALKITASSSDAASWEIQRVANRAGTKMNQVGVIKVGQDLGEWTAGDPNNNLKFVVSTPKLPTFSEETGTPAWYFLQFANSGNTVVSAGVGQNAVQGTAKPEPTQLWQLVGTRDNFYLKNAAGEYLGISGTGDAARLRAYATPQATRFKLVETTNGSYFPAWEIQAVGLTGNSNLNEWGGAVVGYELGFWTRGDVNNPLLFVAQDEMEYADYIVEPSTTYQPVNPLTLWYTVPTTLAETKVGDKWKDFVLPLGNGQLGATVYGGVKKEEIQFNEKTLWKGRSSDNSSSYGAYQNFGSVFIENLDSDAFDPTDAKKATDYARYLDLNKSVAGVQFANADGSVKYTREYIASYPDGVIAMRLKASQPGKQTVRISLKPGSNVETSYADNAGTFGGSFETISYNARMKVVNTGGTIVTTPKGIEVTGADEILVILKGATNFDMSKSTYVDNTLNLANTVKAAVDAAGAKGWEAIYADHQADYAQLFNRVDFQLTGAASTVDTKSLIDQYTQSLKGTADPKALMLEQLYYNYGRYLMISSSRGVDQPSNLQGIWNHVNNAPWGADIHSNINVQMNYWPAEANNLSDLHYPFLNYVITMANSPQWKSYARAAGATKGWTCYTENNIFGGVGSFMHSYVIANAWYSTHLWQHYRYTLDKEYLKKAFPAMWSATQFWLDRLKLRDGKYVCPNEYSPEHGPTEDGVAHAQQLVYDLFSNTKKAIDVLGADAAVDAAELNKLNDRFSKLDNGLAIEKYTGAWGTTVNGITSGTDILREWKYSNYTRGFNGHRHMSHLMCLYPFAQVNPGDDYFQAAVNSLKLRGDESTGWSMGWKINLWARAQDGNHAHKILEYALQHTSSGKGGVFYNLFDVHPEYLFQIDGNFGACAGISEMLMQSQTDTIQFLPALPSVWKEGSMKGMKAVGNFSVDFSWKDSKLAMAKIVSHKGQPLMIKYPKIESDYAVLVNGAPVTPETLRSGLIRVNAAEGDVVTLNFTEAATGISSVSAAAPSLNVQGRQVTVSGSLQTSVVDLAGRHLLTTTASHFTLPAGKAFILTMQPAKGKAISQKVVVE